MSSSTTPRRARRWAGPRALSAPAAGAGLAAATGFIPLGAGTASAAHAAPSFGPGVTSTVYTQTNQGAGNAVLAYAAGPGGALTSIGSFPTGGTGTGQGPGSQGGVTLGDHDRLLAVANGGSNSVSVSSSAPAMPPKPRAGAVRSIVRPSGSAMPSRRPIST